jgi:lipoate---protein ligase
LLYINNRNTNPYLNLAFEEFLLKTYKEDIFMLWQNESTVVVGKHQNTLAEINLEFLENNNIKIARRLSGGGAVFHDIGNLNFTYIINSNEGKMMDFGKYTSKIMEALSKLGVPVQSNKRHDLTINGKKISGNAEHIFKNRVLHHGTLLFNVDLAILEKAISPPPEKYTDKAVKSVRSKVCNILPHLSEFMNVGEFKSRLMSIMYDKKPGSEIREIDPGKIAEVISLSKEKYSTWDWIFGYSPTYEVNNQLSIDDQVLYVHLIVKKGIITSADINGDIRDIGPFREISKTLIGLKHERGNILKHVEQNMSLSTYKDFFIQDFIHQLF